MPPFDNVKIGTWASPEMKPASFMPTDFKGPPTPAGGGLFGGLDRNKIGMILAGVSDAAGIVNGTPGNAVRDFRQAREQAQRRSIFDKHYDQATGRYDTGAIRDDLFARSLMNRFP